MYKSYSIPISVKGIVIENGKVWLRFNQREEWELPGGKIDKGEQPEDACIREIEEELGFKVSIKNLIQAYVFTIESSEDESDGVLVLSYLCGNPKKVSGFETEGEMGNAKYKSFSISEINGLKMPEFYKQAINKAFSMEK